MREIWNPRIDVLFSPGRTLCIDDKGKSVSSPVWHDDLKSTCHIAVCRIDDVKLCDYAIAVVDEIENREHINERFTIVGEVE